MSQERDPSDPALVAAYRSGDQTAASELVRRHTDTVGRYLFALGVAGADVEDLVQETFFKAFRGLDGWRGEGSFRGWLFRIAGNLRRDQFRRSRGRVMLSLEDHDIPDRADPEGETGASEMVRQLNEGLRRLPRLQREVFLLRAQQGLDYEEISAVLKTTPGAARVHYHHAVRRLREGLQ